MPKNVQMPDGAVIAFPDSMDDATIHAEGLKYLNKVMQPPPPVNQNAINASKIVPVSNPLGSGTPSNYLMGNPKTASEGADKAIDVLRYIVPPAAGAIAGTAAAPSAPFTMGAGPVAAGMGAYGLTDSLLEQLKPGNKKKGLDSLKDSMEQAVLNEVGAKIIGGAWKAGKAFLKADQPEILKFLPTASQALKAEGKVPTVASILKYVEDHFAPGAKAAAQEKSAQVSTQLGNKQAANIAGRSTSTVQNPNTMTSLINEELIPEKVPIGNTNKIAPYATDPASMDKLIANPDRLQSALTKSQAAGSGINARQDIAAYHLTQIQQNATTLGPNGIVHIDPAKVFQQLDDPALASTNKILYGSKISDIKQFYKNVAATQDKSQGFGGFGKLRLAAEGIYLSGGLASAMITGNATPVAVALAPIGVEIGLAGLGKVLTNPKTSRLMLALANNDALGVSEQYAARQLMQGLQGTTGALVNSDGSKTQFKIVNGQMVPAGN